MSEHRAIVEWKNDGSKFTDNKYSRAHIWRFDEGVEVPASASPHVVPLPMSVAAAVDPEEAFVASLASCHMLWFLSIAADRGYEVNAYRDAAVGVMGKLDGRVAVTRVTLHPDVRFTGEKVPDRAAVEAMHHAAHESCFIANSVKTEVVCDPVWST